MPRRSPDQTRGRLLQVAEKEFAEHGFAGARVARICRRAGVNQRMLYHYFGSKRGLYRAVYESLTAWMVERLMEKLAAGEMAGPVETFTAFVRAQMELMMRRPTYSRIVLHEALDGFGVDDEMNQRGDPGTPVRAAVLEAVRRGQEGGEAAEPERVVDAMTLAVVVVLVYPVFKSRFTEVLDARHIPLEERDRYVADEIARILVSPLAQQE